MADLAAVRRDLVTVAAPWAAARVLVLVGYVLADLAHSGSPRPVALDDGLVAWDGTWYRDIAERGYDGVPDAGLRFFPLFPLLGRAVAFGLPIGAGPALVVVANVLALATGVLLLRLVRQEGRDAAFAQRSVWLFMLFPSAFVLTWAYSEALMLAAVIGGFLGARRGHWWAAAACGVVAGLSRPLGVLLVIPVAVEAWRAGGLRRRGLSERAAAVAAPGVGVAAYLLWARVADHGWLAPFTEQEQFRGGGIDPVRRLLVDGVRDLLGAERFGDGLHVPFGLIFLVLLAVVWQQWPASYTLFAAAVVVVSMSAENLNSLERYGLSAFPLVLGLAGLTTVRWRAQVVLATSAATLVALTALAWSGEYVP